MSVQTEILNFMRDSQYRIAELTNDINLDNTFTREEKQEKRELRQRLFLFMNLLYITRYTIHNGKTNFLDWADDEILAEIEYLREESDMNPVPAMSFVGYDVEIVKKTGDGGSSYKGAPNKIYAWDASGNPVALNFNQLPGNTAEDDDEDVFTQATPINNPIGNASGILQGKTAIEILELVLNKYLAPAVTSLVNNANGNFANSHVIEIGNSIAGPIKVKATISNKDNVDTEPALEISGNQVSNTGKKDSTLVEHSLTLINPLAPTILTEYSIRARIYHKEGISSWISTLIKFQPKIIWGVSSKAILTQADVDSLTDRRTKITDNPRGAYAYMFAGFPWMLIPSMIYSNDLVFLDDSTPGLTAPYGLSVKQELTINNGVGSYAYKLLRTDNALQQPSKLKIT